MTSLEAFPHIEPEERLYRTQDRGLSAALVTVGFPLIGIERSSDNSVCCFAFPWSEDVDCTVASYWTDHLLVHPRHLIRSLDDIQRMTDARASTGDTVDTS